MIVSKSDKKRSDQAKMRYCMWCRRFTAQIPLKRKWKCLRCKRKLEEGRETTHEIR